MVVRVVGGTVVDDVGNVVETIEVGTELVVIIASVVVTEDVDVIGDSSVVTVVEDDG